MNPFLVALQKAGQFLLEHPDLVEDVYDLFAHGVSKDALKKAIRDLKVAVSDQAVKEELGLDT